MGGNNLCANEIARLLRLDEGLRHEAEAMLKASGLGDIIRSEGFHVVGSYMMQTMTWRDLDFEREVESPNWNRHWELGGWLVKSGWVWRLSCIDAYRNPEITDRGLYWGVRLSDPKGGPVWKIDLWTGREEEFAQSSPNRSRWTGMLSDETRPYVLAIKEAVCELPEYRHTMLSVQIYEAVLDCDVRGVEEFKNWWRKRYG